MLLSTRRSLPCSSRCLVVTLSALVACLLPTFQHASAEAEGPTSAQANGRIYVATIYRVEQPVRADGAIIAIDPATGDWRIIVEKDATKGGAGNAVRLSPDRRTLVFSRVEDGIWKCESDGQFPIKIFDHRDNWLLRPVWSADGKHLVASNGKYITKDSKELLRTETWQIDADGRNAVKLPIPDTDTVEDWSPDGQWFVTYSTRNHGLYLMKTDGTQERSLTEGRGGGSSLARFSPDGKKIVHFQQTRAEGRSIWTVDVDGGHATKLVAEADLSVPDGAFWSPDGKQIAVVLYDLQVDEKGQKTYPRLGTGNFGIEVMDADGTNRRRIPLKGEKIPFISSFGDWR